MLVRVRGMPICHHCCVTTLLGSHFPVLLRLPNAEPKVLNYSSGTHKNKFSSPTGLLTVVHFVFLINKPLVRLSTSLAHAALTRISLQRKGGENMCSIKFDGKPKVLTSRVLCFKQFFFHECDISSPVLCKKQLRAAILSICSPVDIHKGFGGTFCLNLQGQKHAKQENSNNQTETRTCPFSRHFKRTY
jgi:hypothetical protein